MEQKELRKPTFFWAKVGDTELKPIDVKAVDANFDIEPNDTLKWENEKSYNVSFDLTLDNKSSKNIRKMFYCRVPRKLKKWQKKQVSLFDGKPIKHLRYDYLGCYYWIK